MSSAFYPLGMKTSNNHVPQGGYESWKGRDIFSNPTAITAGNIRPATNKDYTNTVFYKQGSQRPIRHYRRGITTTGNTNSSSGKSSWLIGQILDTPGQYIVKENTPTSNATPDCKVFKGTGMVVDYMPSNFLTDNPRPVTESMGNCCNAQRKALDLVKPASTNLSKNYFTTHAQYMQNRCQTYNQKVFNFIDGPGQYQGKPGSPDSLRNTYYAQCYPGTEKGCQKTIYKPSNYQYAVEGGVSSSSRTYRLTINTIKKNLA